MSTETETAPIVSVIMPCYNHVQYVERAIKSVMDQDYHSFELIVVDDCSTDGTSMLLDALREIYDFTLVRLGRNEGVAVAMNRGIEYASGHFIANMDSDDIMMPGRLKLQADYLTRNPNVGLVGGKSIYIDSNGNEIKRERLRDKMTGRALPFSEILSNLFVVAGPVTMFRLSAIGCEKAYDERLRVQDLYLTMRIGSGPYEVHVLPEWLTLYRRHQTNISRIHYLRQYVDDLCVIERFSGMPEYKAARTEAANRVLKYATRDRKLLSLKILATLPIQYWDKVTFRRLRRLVFSWHHYLLNGPIDQAGPT